MIKASAARQFCIGIRNVGCEQSGGCVLSWAEQTYNTKSVSVSSIRVVHRRNIDSAFVHEIVIRDHDSGERSQEYGVSVHETQESLDATCKAPI